MEPRKWLKDSLENQRGSVMVLLTVVMTVLLAVTALVTDVGVNYVTQTKLSMAADAAALAGGRKLDEGRDIVIQTALEIVEKNGVSAANTIVEVDESGKGVTVRTQAPIQLFFARIFGAEGGMMEQRARVAKTKPIAFYKVFPLGVDRIVKLDYSKEVNLFSDALLGSGNWGALSFKDENGNYLTGSNVLRQNLIYGYDGLVTVGDWSLTSGGVSMGPIREAIDYRFQEAAKTHQCSLGECPTGCPRILIMPIYIEILDSNKNKTGEVDIVDFAAFWVSRMSGSGANTEIWGHFVKPFVHPAASVEGESEYGLTTIKLVQ